jgi:predicted transposase YbfD/YdcC
MSDQPIGTLHCHFRNLEEPRSTVNRRHLLMDVLTLAICGMICGADDWVAMEAFGKAKQDWFKGFLELPNGIPSHDTFGRVFARLCPEQFQQCFASWVQAVAQRVEQVVAIDGKTARRSHDRGQGKAALHMVSAWASANRLILGQVSTKDKSNEITAIPRLLEILEISGCIVTIDAMGCQKKIAQTIVDKDAAYILAVKDNQPSLLEDIKPYFDGVSAENPCDNPTIHYTETVEGDHGRIETRRHWLTDAIDWLRQHHSWANLQSIAMVQRQREVGDQTSLETHYYICSLPADPDRFARSVRAHWGIENSVHWVLDMSFREDESRVRTDHAPENLSTLRRLALNLIRHENTAKLGVKNKRLKAGWDENYLSKVLNCLDP